MRRWLWILLPLGWLLAGCAAGPGQPPVPTPRLAYVGRDDHIYSLAVEGGDPRRLSSVAGEAPVPAGQRLARWPTWSPDGTRLAFMRFEQSRTAGDRATIFVVGSDGSGLVKVFESVDEPPIYMAWTPDGGRLTLLTQRGNGLRLQVLDPAGAAAAREVAAGNPLYFAWSPDSQNLLVHVNGDVRLNDQAMIGLWRAGGGSGAALPFASQPGDFRAPGWSADGVRMGFITRIAGGQTALAVQDLNVPEPIRLASTGLEPAFVWSPATDRLAFSSRLRDEVPLYRGVETIKADGSDRQQVTDAPVAAFYWSPDGRRLAYAALDVQNRALVWNVSDPDGKNRKQVASFAPGQDQLLMFRFFDQYAPSHGVWSPDGKYLVYAGTQPGGQPSRRPADPSQPPGSEPPEEPPRVFVVPADGSAAPRALVDGSIGLWPVSPPRKR